MCKHELRFELRLFLAGLVLLVPGVLLGQEAAPVEAQPVAAAGNSYELARCISVATERNPGMQDAQYAVEEAEASRKSLRGNLLPKLTVEGNVMVWSQPIEMSFGGSSGGASSLLPPPNPADPYEVAFFGMLQGFSQKTVIQKQVTWGTTTSISQPVSTLYTLMKAMDVKDVDVDLANLRKAVQRRDLALQVAEAFFQLSKARSGLETVTAALQQLESMQKRTAAFFMAQLVGKNEMLRMDVAISQVRQQKVLVESAISMGKTALAVAMGLPDAGKLEIAVPETVKTTIEVPAEEELFGEALISRPEVSELGYRKTQAGLGVDIARGGMIPVVAVSGSWQHTEGSTFANKDSYFVGAFLQWDVWQWGTTYYSIDEANARARRVEAARKQVADMIRMEVAAARQELLSTLEAISLAEVALSQAEENYRVESRLFDSQTVSAADLVEAHSLLVQSRNQVNSAHYDLLLALARLNKAAGRPIVSGTLAELLQGAKAVE